MSPANTGSSFASAEQRGRGGASSGGRHGLVACVFAAVLAIVGCTNSYPPPPTPPPPTYTPVDVPTPTAGGPTVTTTATATPPDQPCSVPPIDVHRSLVVHDPALLATPFAFKKTIDAIIATSGGPATTASDLVKTMLDSFLASSFVQPVSGKTVPVKPRPQEAALPPGELLDPAATIGMVPVGLFNRLDLAPDDGSNCGEYRIVYAKKNPGAGRFFIIFESKLPNPDPSAGLAGCQPVARFWADLSADPSSSSVITALEKFYYTGLPGFSPVVTHGNYGMALGQVRTNLFVESLWELREHRTAFDTTTGVAVFKVDTVKDNPMVEWFRVPGDLPPGFTPADQDAFRKHYLAQPICNLLRPDRVNPTATTFEVVNGIGPGFDPGGNDFRSVSQGPEDNPAVTPDAAFTPAIATRIAALNGTVNAGQVLNRTGAMECGGCHQFSNGVDLGNGHSWPPSGGFVHIDEQGTLSPALNSFFLPARAKFLERFTCDPTAEPKPAAPCPTPAAAGGVVRKSRGVLPALPSDEGLDPAIRAMLERGSAVPTLRSVNEARAAFLGSIARQDRAPSRDAASPASRDVANAARVLEERVQETREREQALPGAFVPVRRTH